MKRLSFIPIIFLWCSVALATDPTISGISGTLTQGNSLIISGADFGSKATAAPLKFEDFEDGVADANLTSTGYWSISTDGDEAQYKPSFSNENLRTGTGLNARVYLDKDGGSLLDCFYKNNITGLSTSGYIYVDFHARFDSGNANGAGGVGSNDYQVKLWRIINEYIYTYPAVSSFNWFEKDLAYSTYYYQLTREDYETHGTQSFYGNSYDEDSWNHVQLIMYVGTSGNTDGNLTISTNCTTVAEDNTVNFLNDTDRSFQTLMFGEYIGNYSSIITAPVEYFDDIYVDNTWERVELGNNATYTSCTIREIQIPTAWADGSITIDANTGNFSSGTKVYGFVFNSAGVANTVGFEIEIGEAGGEPAPPSSSGNFTRVTGGRVTAGRIG